MDIVSKLREIIKPFTPAIGVYDTLQTGSEHYRRRQSISKETTSKIGSVVLTLLYIAIGVVCAYLSFAQNKMESMMTKILYATMAVFFGVFYLAYYVLRYGLNVPIL